MVVVKKKVNRGGEPVRWHLKKGVLPKNIRWMQDADYLGELSEKELDWYNKFVREFYDGNVKKGKGLHRKQALRRDCYNRKNAANRDLFGILDCQGKLFRNGEMERSSGPSSGRKRRGKREDFD